MTDQPTQDRAESALHKQQENESTLRALLENARHIAVYRVAHDPENPFLGKILLVSPSIRDIVGLKDPFDFSSWFDNIHPDDRQRVINASLRSSRENIPYNQTARFNHPGKQQWVWLHTVSSPHFDSSGRAAYFDGLVIDITDQMVLREAELSRKAAEGLREIIQIINTNRQLQEILDFIAFQSCQLLQASATMIRHLDEDKDAVITVTSYNLPQDYAAMRVMPFYRTRYDRRLINREPYAIEDIRAEFQPLLDDPSLEPYSELQRMNMEADIRYYRSFLKAPIFLKDSMYGGITFYYDQPRTFQEEDMHLATTLADQAALAIENARLIDQVKVSAVVEERSRLARELHDAVTQTLFSTSLIAEVLPTIFQRSQSEGFRRLDELRQLTRGALAEMRTLLLELRPAALADADLCDLLRHLVNAFIGRSRVPVDLQIKGACEIPLEVKIALYRITQEALNNISKHAGAEHVSLELSAGTDSTGKEEILLTVRDDGQGFDPSDFPTDHLGLGIMRERAAQIGAQIEITSRSGQGTQITVCWNAGKGVENNNGKNSRNDCG